MLSYLKKLLFAGLVTTAAPINAVPCSGDIVSVSTQELPRAGDGYFEQVEKVAEGVWLIAQPSFQVQPSGNVTVIEQSDGLVVVDSGGSRGGALRIIELIRSVSPKTVKAIVLTHWHGDHVQGLSEFLRAWPAARTISTHATRAHLGAAVTMNSPSAFDAVRNGELLSRIDNLLEFVGTMSARAQSQQEKCDWAQAARLLNQYRLDMDHTLTVPTKEGFENRLELPDPQRPVTALYLSRANTDGDAVVWLARQRIVVTGDIVVAPFPYGTNSYPADWLVALEKLRSLEFRLLIPGHGPVQHNGVYLSKLEAALRHVIGLASSSADVKNRSAVASNREPVPDHVSAFIGDDQWQRRWFAEFWEKPIFDAATRQMRGETILQRLGSQ